jgi:hypothetical protein
LDAGFSKGGIKASKMKWKNRAPTSFNRIEVAEDTAYEQYPTSQTKLSVGGQQGDKPHESSVGSDLEGIIIDISVANKDRSLDTSRLYVSPLHKEYLLTTAEAQAEERTLRQQPYGKIGRASLGMSRNDLVNHDVS